MGVRGSMSAEARKWAWGQPLPHIPHKVLVALADKANEKKGHTAWPSKKTLMAMTNLSRRGLMLQLRRLENEGYITRSNRFRDNGSHTSSTYTLHMGVGHDTCPPLGHVSVPPLGAQKGAPLYEPHIEPHIEPQNTGKPGQEKILSIVQDTMDGVKPLPKNDIIYKANRHGKILKPSGCGYIWKHFRRTAGASGFQPEMLRKELKLLSGSYDRLGEVIWIEAVWVVMHNWIEFTKYAKDKGGAYQLPQTPKVEFFVKFCAEAAEFSILGKAKQDDWVQPIAKPLTKPTETKENNSNAMTHEQVLAINKEFQD